MPDRYDVLRPKLNELRLTIIREGPLTVYEAYTRLRKSSVASRKKVTPLATVDRNLKILLEQGEIEIIATEPHKSGQVKKIYGLTPYGFLRYFRVPGAPVLKHFGEIARIWLQVPKFRFFVPKKEALNAINSKQVEYHLARYCQLVANLFGEAEDFLDCLVGAGFVESKPDQIIELSTQLAWSKYGRRFAESLKVLTDNLPTLKNQIQSYLMMQRKNLDEIENYLFVKGAKT